MSFGSLLSSNYYAPISAKNPRSVGFNMMDCSLEVQGFELHLRLYIHFRIDIQGKY